MFRARDRGEDHPTRPRRAPRARGRVIRVGLRAGRADWQQVDLPGPGRVVTLTGTTDGLLVGRYDPTAVVRPSLHLLASDGTTRRITMLTTWKESGREAELVSVSTFGDQMVALGGARAGAHGNVRWTVWSGSTDQVSEQPQRFETFGGWDAGSLTGTAISRSGPLILGSWANRGRRGLDVAVWEQQGEGWFQPRGAGNALQASATRQPSSGAATALPSGYLAVGWATELEPRIRDAAVLWTATRPAGPWRAMTFPGTDADIERPTALSCARDHCAVAGRSGGDVVLWRVRLEEGSPTKVAGPTPSRLRPCTARTRRSPCRRRRAWTSSRTAKGRAPGSWSWAPAAVTTLRSSCPVASRR